MGALRARSMGRDWQRTACPFCEDEGHRDRKGSLSVQKSTGWWHCFRCGIRGRLDGFEDEDLDDVLEAPDASISQFDPPYSFVELYSRAGRTSETLAPAHAYLRARGVSPSLAARRSLGACTDGRWDGRVIVPFILEGYPRWVGWIGRLWVPKPSQHAEGVAAQTYLYPKGMTRGTFLYNHDAIYKETDEPLLIVEGAFDSFPFGDDAAAALGKPTGVQIEAMVNAKRPLCIVLDGDSWIESEMLCARLRFEGARAGWIKLPPGADPATSDSDELKDAARRSIDAPL